MGGEFNVKTGDTHATPDSNYSKLYPKTDNKWYYKKPDGSEHALEVNSSTKCKIFNVEFDSNTGNYRTQGVLGSGAHRFTFAIPKDFDILVSIHLVGICSSSVAGAGKSVDLYSNYAAIGEAYNTHEESDTTTVHDFTGMTDKFIEIELTDLFSSVSACDICGVQVDHQSIGGSIYYTNLSLEYTT